MTTAGVRALSGKAVRQRQKLGWECIGLPDGPLWDEKLLNQTPVSERWNNGWVQKGERGKEAKKVWKK